MSRLKVAGLGGALVVALWFAGSLPALGPGRASDPQSPLKEFTIKARRYAYSPDRIEVSRGDAVKITLIAEDIAHSFTIDEYRISKRAAPGQPVTFEFTAGRAGRFVYYCNLTADEGCRGMRGELIVK